MGTGRRARRGQSVLEYAIVLTAVIIAIAAAAVKGGPIANAIKKMFDNISSRIETASDKIKGGGGGPQPVP